MDNTTKIWMACILGYQRGARGRGLPLAFFPELGKVIDSLQEQGLVIIEDGLVSLSESGIQAYRKAKASTPAIQIFTDGSVYPNPNGIGGWGAIVVYPEKEVEISGSAVNTTNNRMELTAVIEALKILKTPCQIALSTDSQYVQRGMTEWVEKWQARKWSHVKNVDLWLALLEVAKPHDITWLWVKGHSGDQYNERCDKLAEAARQVNKLANSVGNVP